MLLLILCGRSKFMGLVIAMATIRTAHMGRINLSRKTGTADLCHKLAQIDKPKLGVLIMSHHQPAGTEDCGDEKGYHVAGKAGLLHRRVIEKRERMAGKGHEKLRIGS